MRIAYVINSVEGGGAAAPVPMVCDVLRRQGAEIKVFALTGRDRRGLPAMHAAGLDVYIREDGERDHRQALRWLDQEFTAWRPDIVWTSLTRATLLGQIAAKRLQVPAVSWQHAAYLRPANRALLRLRQRASSLWLADSDCVATLTRQRLAVPEGRLMTWPLFAVDSDAPQALPWRPGEMLRIGSLGRLHPVKGFDILLNALARLRRSSVHPATPFELHIAGEGDERGRLESLIAHHGLADIVKLAGFTAHPRQFLATLHLYVQPSRSEGLCIAVHEAMQAGLPCIGSAVGEMPYSIQHGQTGLVVPPDDEEALSFALAHYLRLPEKLGAIGAAARGHVHQKLSRQAFEATGRAVFKRVAALLPYGSSARHPATSRAHSDRSASRRSA
ncbi:glycosyltransferase [Sphingobium sp. GW456-12-10-14-TSB1]|uniref:glycosyltransferase n=1 Tax=Sphingobium sp. GW456-12-10-14-TSB1 TaxID=1987165 RepID=UPI000A3632E6|nr:glycosyltransferase [Sphingobium sp. GW456-12-10-14-TSB1]OUC52922.1 glycosyltransferase [Sphingobium sp. GW456-12-10-14-TSB1]